MIHWRFLLQKSYIFVCGIVGIVILTLGLVWLIWLGLYLIPLTFLFLLILGAAFGTVVQRIYPHFTNNQIILDSALVGFIVAIPFGISSYIFAMRIACDGKPNCDWLNYYSIPDMLSKSSIFLYLLSTFVIAFGTMLTLLPRCKTSQ
jgi:hypothetical protein